MSNIISIYTKKVILMLCCSLCLGAIFAQNSIANFASIKKDVYFPTVDPATFNNNFELLNPNRFPGPYQVKKDKGNSYYLQRSKKAMKHGQYLIAALYAFHGAAVIEKPKQLKKLGEIANEAYPKAQVMVKEKVTQLKASGFEGDRTALNLNNCLSLYKNLDQLNDLYNRFTEDQQNAVGVKTKRYGDEIIEAREMLTEANQLLAAIHFEKAKKMAQQAKSRGDFFEAARRARHARFFGSNEQIDELAKVTVEEGTTYFALSPLRNFSGRNFDGVAIQYQVQRELFDLQKRGSLHSMFNVVNHIDNTDNMRLNLDIATAGVSYTRNEPYPQTRTKKVGKEGSEQVYKGIYTEYRKYSTINIICDYEIIDTETEEVLKRGQLPSVYEHTGIWGSYTGNIKALSKYEQDNVRLREPAFLSEGELTVSGNQELTRDIVEHVKVLAKKYGVLPLYKR